MSDDKTNPDPIVNSSSDDDDVNSSLGDKGKSTIQKLRRELKNAERKLKRFKNLNPDEFELLTDQLSSQVDELKDALAEKSSYIESSAEKTKKQRELFESENSKLKSELKFKSKFKCKKK